jgi:hypothetical protein
VRDFFDLFSLALQVLFFSQVNHNQTQAAEDGIHLIELAGKQEQDIREDGEKLAEV